MKLAIANKGRSLETLVKESAAGDRVVCIDKTQAGAAWGGGRRFNTKGLVDWVGHVVGRRPTFLAFDCKVSGKSQGFYLSDLAPHQRAYLIRHGEANGVCGLLVEATHPDVSCIMWIPWQQLKRTDRACIPWHDENVVTVGTRERKVDWTRIPGIAPAASPAAAAGRGKS